MSALRDEEWLHIAKRLPVGGHTRVRHLNESRLNLVIQNKQDRYVAYCQRCHKGGVHMKEHVVYTGRPAPKASEWLGPPTDCVQIIDADEATKAVLTQHLHSKGMDWAYLHPAYVAFSKERQRLVLSLKGCLLGRDLSGNAKSKWLAYNTKDLSTQGMGAQASTRHRAVVVEDPYSFFKLAYLFRDSATTDVWCAQGTRIRPSVLAALIPYEAALFFYDGDKAGRAGAASDSARLQALGVQHVRALTVEGKDPKDLTLTELRDVVSSMS